MARFTHEKIVLALLGGHVTVIHVSIDFSHFSCLGCILRYTRGYCIIYYGQAFVSFGVFCSRNSIACDPRRVLLIQDALGMSCTWFRPYGNLIAPSRLILVDVTSGQAASISVVDASHLFSTFRGWLFTEEVFLYQLLMFFDCDGTFLIISRSHR